MKLGVIGCGKMGTAFVAGAIRSGVVAAADVIGIDPIKAAAVMSANFRVMATLIKDGEKFLSPKTAEE